MRFRLEGIDTGWKVVSARRVLPGELEPKANMAEKPAKPPESKSEPVSPGEMQRLQAMRQSRRDAHQRVGYTAAYE